MPPSPPCRGFVRPLSFSRFHRPEGEISRDARQTMSDPNANRDRTRRLVAYVPRGKATSETYRTLGFRCGLEVHQQLRTARKLFCRCPAGRYQGRGDYHAQLVRHMRPTLSELGEYDGTALMEFKTKKNIIYRIRGDTACTYDIDDTPPFPLNRDALDIAIRIALLLDTSIVGELHITRKQYLDGSIPTGFQRTAIVGIDGGVPVAGRRVGIRQLSVEEDSCREVSDRGHDRVYTTDRLGMPLVETVTEPELLTPDEAAEAANYLRYLARSTGLVNSGIGAAREDVNVSVAGGTRVEIKGVQKLELISKAVESEVQRQTALLEIREELTKRGAREEEVRPGSRNLTDVFKGTKSKVIEKGLNKGGVVLGVKLPKFKGLLGRELIPNVRLGTELSWHAMLYGGVGGIFHSDELPGYGITEKDLQEIHHLLTMRDLDAAVLVCDIAPKAEDALKAVVERAKVALTGVPEETRAALEDGTSRYMRPRPGAARMYPETDIPPFVVSEGRVKAVEENLPEMPESLTKKIMEQYGVNHKLATQLLDSDYLTLFEEAASTTQIAPSFIATILTETLKSLERRKVPVDDLTEGQLQEVFRLVDSKTTAKESAEAVIEWLCAHKGRSAGEALTALNLKMVSVEELEKRIDAIIKQNQALIREMGDKAVGKLIGIAMGDFRGRAEAGEVMRIVKEKLRAR